MRSRKKYGFAIHLAVTAMVMVAAMNMTAFAAGWQQNATGWWYGTNADNSQWYSGGWQWIDGNGDGIAESYYFDQNGYIAANTTMPDGDTVNADGAWVVNGVVQTQNAQSGTEQVQNTYDVNGISNIAIDMLHNTRAQNAAKYGETDVVYVSGKPIVTYGNGFGINYLKDTTDEIADRVMAGYKNTVTDLFRDAQGVTTADKGAELLSKKGYSAVSDGINVVIDIEPYQMFWDVSNNSIEIGIMKNYK